MFVRRSILACVLFALPAAPALAQVFKCVDDKTGKISFSDTRCDTRSSGGRVQVKPNTLDTSGSREQIYRRQARDQYGQGDAADALEPVAARTATRECEQATREYENEAGSIYRDPAVAHAKRRYMEAACDAAQGAVPTSAAGIDAAKLGSSACAQARREYENEVASIVADAIAAANKRTAMLDACGMDEGYGRGGRAGGSAGVDPARTRRPETAPYPDVPAARGSARVPAVVSSCDSGGCWDVAGQRYHGTGPVYFPANGGQACQLIGERMHCP